MLMNIWNEETESGEDMVVGSTIGCGWCSDNVYGKEDIIEQLTDNMRFLLRSCKVLGITLEDLQKMVEEKEKKKNRFYNI